jgi:arylformamidase
MTAPLLTPEYCERGYDNRAAVPEFPQYFKRWAEDSAAVRSTLRCVQDVRYGGRPRETLDLFPAGGRRGLLIFIHGGYWRALDKSDHSFIAPPLVAEGFDVAVINYDLCPDVTIGTIALECRNALGWLVKNGAQRGIATDNIVICGHSAGGHLVAMLQAADLRQDGVDPGVIKGMVSISGLFDLEPFLYIALNADLRLDAASAAAWSPVRMQPAVRVPLLLAAGASETSEFLRQSQMQWDAWPQVRPAGSTGPMLLTGRHHFSAIDCLADSAHPLFRETVGLFAPRPL